MSIKKRIREIERLGWTVEVTGGGHLKLTQPATRKPVFAACTSSSESGWLNMLAQMRRALRAEAARP